MEWGRAVDRPMPWKSSTDPYKIWLSEIILQQTRVAQGWNYYERLLLRFPNVESLAIAPLSDLIREWEGLGYYTRARNLHKCAQIIWFDLGGKFPETYDQWLQLPGIGPYTAAAISSFAFAEKRAVVDGNVIRVLSRVFGIEQYPVKTQEKREFESIAQSLIDPASPGKYNQAIMDFGAVQCMPTNPDCNSCPMNTFCYAYLHDAVSKFPQKQIKPDRQERNFHFILIQDAEHWYFQRREGSDIWKDLYQPICIEGKDQFLNKASLAYLATSESQFIKDLFIQPYQLMGPYVQLLTHQKINAFIYLFQVMNFSQIPSELLAISKSAILDLPMPRVLKKFFQNLPLEIADEI